LEARPVLAARAEPGVGESSPDRLAASSAGLAVGVSSQDPLAAG
jgi:hypothetical protein